ncbi:hypothetical protein [Paenibacillus naphthalenovorans]|uniref:hypothetical protein n=1 Tax=Paenibacillus naphthalenovorans TaxID=162209 RepID=UPI001587AACC|nr:hypothetical protein [Paenibacillus naphthalenovorans]
MLILLAIALGFMIYISYMYWMIRSTTIEDIVQRQHVQEDNGKLKEPESTSPILGNTLEKANEFANKPISKQDAMDAAAILLNSGLSMRDIYFLLGQATDKLNNEEKQHIRDLLLQKLSQQEIDALKAITGKYGKNLIILDPNYPIELVGVYDEEERKKIKKELEARKKQQSSTEEPPTQSTSAPPEAAPSAPSANQRDPKSGITAEIENKYRAELEKLKNTCQAEANGIVNEISAAMGDQEQLDNDALQTIKDKYFKKIADAEKRCSGQVDRIIQNAKQELRDAGLNDTGPNAWKQEYESLKSQAQSKALSRLQNS